MWEGKAAKIADVRQGIRVSTSGHLAASLRRHRQVDTSRSQMALGLSHQ